MLKHLLAALCISSVLFPSISAEEELPKVLRFSTPMVSVSAVQGKKSAGAELTVENTGDIDFAFVPVFVGKDARSFSVEPAEVNLGAGKAETFVIRLSPLRGAGSYEAALNVAEGSIPVKGVGLKSFEGTNEPTLDRLVKALGMDTDVGGAALSLDTESQKIGESLPPVRFSGIEGKPVRITALARFSPPGELPFGIINSEGDLKEWGVLGASDSDRPDNHQCLFPLLSNGDHLVEKKVPSGLFSVYLKENISIASTDPDGSRENEAVTHSTRVYPVRTYQGVEIVDAFLVAFEEAKNGDYQDAVFLLENVTSQ